MVFVTHDQEEAMLLADKMALLDEGRLVQYGTPAEIYQHPATPEVSAFLGLDDLVWQDDGTVYKRLKGPDKEDPTC